MKHRMAGDADIVCSKQKAKASAITEKALNDWGLTGIHLRPYQLDGVNWLSQCVKRQHGCILGDEMGLGKTCQTIALLLYLKGGLKKKTPCLVLCPLSVLSNWEDEMKRFSPDMSFAVYAGEKEKRKEMQHILENKTDFHVVLSTYEICVKDAAFLKSRFDWCALVVDEAHRLKNANSLLHRTLSEFSVGFTVLLTGTPVQNSLEELHSLLSFIEPSTFHQEKVEEFVHRYHGIEKNTKKKEELHNLLQPFLLRRVKADVALDLPKKTEVVVYHGMSAMQKKFYKVILTKDPDAFEKDTGAKTKLLNVLVQLRKCVDHPYLFDGVEPEPFEIGEHLVDASGKLYLLDKMLAFLYSGNHRVLIFSQMTRMLDILQDYMEFRGYSYERLDGSVRGEERHLAINSFSQKPVFVFLLSTKAGGVGMNLTAADTVIFVDSDFNPQNDLQAAARAHRIGQNKPVKIIRLLARDTIEEIIYRRAVSKLKLTNTVIEGGQFSLKGKSEAEADMQLSEILKFGLDTLLSTDESTIQEVDLINILGKTQNGKWMDMPLPAEETENMDSENHMYLFEGKDYSKEPSTRDKDAFDQLLDLQKVLLEDTDKKGRALRSKDLPTSALYMPLSGTSIKRVLSPEELENRRRKRQEAAAKRAKLIQEAKKRKEEAEYKERMLWWESCGYKSSCIPSDDSDTTEESEEDGGDYNLDLDSTNSDKVMLNYVIGDITHPKAEEDENAIIVHCVDNSGYWGRGGLFTALESRSDEPKNVYEMAGTMKDLKLGGVLLFRIDDKESRAQGQDWLSLIVAQQRDRSNNVSGIKLSALEDGLKKIYLAAKKMNASVHLPRIGHATKGFNWYGSERLIRKYLAAKGIPTFIYYYPRTSSRMQQPATSRESSLSPTPELIDLKDQTTRKKDLPNFMNAISVYFYNIPEDDKKNLSRYLISYDGNIVQDVNTETTHVVATVENVKQAEELYQLLKENTGCILVKPRWLQACFYKQKKISPMKYRIDLTAI
ncbi:chromodomain-helicase-DNA-binding protein 1-like [Ambystoma mexicanum]|uniref:chromodomain-helicase-DNA-binding protein 1-like n=1 Tax=Ambystoma mexicanum TaxID=8296 RepID=UPI0037E702F8